MTFTSINLPSFPENRVALNIRSDSFHKCKLYYNECLINEVSGEQGLNSLFTDLIDGHAIGIILLPIYSQCRLEVEHDGEHFNLHYDIETIDFDRKDYLANGRLVRFANGSVGTQNICC